MKLAGKELLFEGGLSFVLASTRVYSRSASAARWARRRPCRTWSPPWRNVDVRTRAASQGQWKRFGASADAARPWMVLAPPTPVTEPAISQAQIWQVAVGLSAGVVYRMNSMPARLHQPGAEFLQETRQLAGSLGLPLPDHPVLKGAKSG